MDRQHATFVLRDDPRVVGYVEFLRDELGDEKLVQKALTQPFYASYRTYKRYGNPTDENRLRHIQIPISCSEIVAEAIKISRKHSEEPDELVLQRILFDYLQVDAPPEAYKH